MGLADAQLLSNAAAATIFVVGAGQARTGALRGTLRRLEIARAPLIGAVLTKYNAKTAGYGADYGYGYGYGQAHQRFEQLAPDPSGEEQLPELPKRKSA